VTVNAPPPGSLGPLDVLGWAYRGMEFLSGLGPSISKREARVLAEMGFVRDRRFRVAVYYGPDGRKYTVGQADRIARDIIKQFPDTAGVKPPKPPKQPRIRVPPPDFQPRPFGLPNQITRELQQEMLRQQAIRDGRPIDVTPKRPTVNPKQAARGRAGSAIARGARVGGRILGSATVGVLAGVLDPSPLGDSDLGYDASRPEPAPRPDPVPSSPSEPAASPEIPSRPTPAPEPPPIETVIVEAPRLPQPAPTAGNPAPASRPVAPPATVPLMPSLPWAWLLPLAAVPFVPSSSSRPAPTPTSPPQTWTPTQPGAGPQPWTPTLPTPGIPPNIPTPSIPTPTPTAPRLSDWTLPRVPSGAFDPLTPLLTGSQPLGLPSALTSPAPSSPNRCPPTKCKPCEQTKRRRRKKGTCRQGYFREFPDRTEYITWSRRKCQ